MIWLSDKTAINIKSVKKSYNIWGKEITFERGKMWLLASWAILISDTNDNVLFTTVGFKEHWVNKEADFFPLVVDFQEKFYATWKIGWNRFQRREWRSSDAATLTARLIDRPIRPMFPKWIVNDTQVICSVLSSNWEIDLGFWWVLWASLGLMMSGAPFQWPVAWVKVSLIDGEFIFNPTVTQEKESKLNLIVAGTLDAITMVEAGWNEVSDDEMIAGLEFSFWLIKELCNAQIDFIKIYEKSFWIPTVQATYNNPDESLYLKVKEFLTDEKCEDLYNKWKKEFQKILDTYDIEVRKYLIKNKLVNYEEDHELNFVWSLVYKRVKEVMRKNIIEKSKRLDNRKIDEVREVIWEIWLLPRAHWSALFCRGMTQALSIVTLWWPDDEMTIEGMMSGSSKRYMHHYNFPPYSVWEVRMMRWVGRREIGHWALAERALEPVLPNEEEFPYVVRVVSEITTCNGSSSMASVCGSTMSLMNAWVPIKRPVAWVAMWMIYEEETWKYKILSDIQAQEDFLWDMDFKVARTKDWITAMQLDVKIKWLKMDIFKEAFSQSKWAVEYILEQMLKAQPKVAEKLSPYAPLIMNMQIKIDQIKIVIWKWWENIQRMEKDFQVKISIAEDGMTTITAENQEWWLKAIEDIKRVLWVPSVWEQYDWKVVKIIDWVWAIVEFKKTSWMIHISKLSSERVINVEDIVKVWDNVKIDIIQVDLDKGRIGLKKI